MRTKLTLRQINSLRLHAQEKFEQQDFKTAKRCFVEIVEQMHRFNQNPPTSVLFNTAMCYFKFKNYERVEEYLNLLLKSDPFSALACFYLGICYKLAIASPDLKNNIPLENIPDTDFFQEAINCIRRRPTHKFVSSATKISPVEVEIDSIFYQPLGLELLLSVQDCKMIRSLDIEDISELPESVDFKIFKIKHIHSAGLQVRSYIQSHVTIRNDAKKVKEVKEGLSEKINKAFLRKPKING